MENLSLSKKPMRNNKVVWRTMDNEAIILGTEKQKIYTTDKIGNLIWTSLDGKTKISGIIGEIVKEFKVRYKEAKKDTLNFINELDKNNLLIFK